MIPARLERLAEAYAGALLAQITEGKGAGYGVRDTETPADYAVRCTVSLLAALERDGIARLRGDNGTHEWKVTPEVLTRTCVSMKLPPTADALGAYLEGADI